MPRHVSIETIAMAEINISSHEKAPRRKVLSTRVDLTPMVDLGFLLITFFIFTTKMGEPTTMKLAVPKESIKDSMKIADTKTLNFILSGDDSLYYYEGSAVNNIKKIGYNKNVRDVIAQKRKTIESQGYNPKDLTVLLKPTLQSSYKNVVDILDEMMISQVKTYILMEPSAEEIKKAANLRVRSL